MGYEELTIFLVYMTKKPKRIAAFFDAPKLDDYPFDDDLYRTNYKQLGKLCAEEGAEFWVVRAQESFLGSNTFSHGWKFDGEWFAHVDETVEMDLIWNKGYLKSDKTTRVINNPALDELATDKWKTYEMFSLQHSPSRLLQTMEDWKKAQKELQSDVLVVKPLTGFGGDGVIIAARSELQNINPPLPGIAQEFVDTSGGIPGIVDGKHDLRVIMINDAIGVSYIRTPPEGGMKANISLGGRVIEVDITKLPHEALDMIHAIDKKLRKFKNRFYTIDMGRDVSGRWCVFELNSKPGFQPMEKGESFELFFHKLVDFLIENA
jgi:hypothetical protein